MFWDEENSSAAVKIPDDIVDLLFSIECRQLPVDHAYPLSAALHDALPWLAKEERAAIHQVHVAASQNGWERPAEGDGVLHLSKRTKLTLRLPRDRLDDARLISGATLDIAGHPMKIGTSKIRPLSKLGTIFSRYVVSDEPEEERFLRRVIDELETKEVQVKKALCGIVHTLQTEEGPLHTRSLLLADLKPEDSIRLQREGLGSHRKLGCGIFIPHKGIDPVTKQEDDTGD
jgi:CRISPR-associated protein Cas6